MVMTLFTWLLSTFIPIAMLSSTSLLQHPDQHSELQCSSHGKPLEVHCDTCDKLICYLCTVKQHRDHEYDVITDVFPRFQQRIMDGFKQVDEKLTVITTAVQAMETQKGGFLEQVGAARKEIEATVQQLIQLLQESGKKLMKELDQVTDISPNKEEAIAQLKSCQELIEEKLKNGSQQEILAMKEQLMEHMAAVCSQVKEDYLEQVEENKVVFLKSDTVLKACRSLGSVVRYDRSDCLETPLKLDMMTRKAGQSFTGLSPHGLTITKEDHLVVAEWGNNSITIIDPTNGKKMRTFGEHGTGQVQFKSPCGVALTQDDNIVVAECNGSRLQLLTAEGAFIATVKMKHHRHHHQHQHPFDVAVGCNGKIFATIDDLCVQVFNADLGFSHRIGSLGCQPGQFLKPRGITVDTDGMIYVADYRYNRVQKFTPEGKLLAVISSKGEEDPLDHPHGLCVDGNSILYVTELHDNTVSMFTSEGKFLGYIGDSDGSSFNKPRYIVSSLTGQLYISDDNGVHTYMY